METTISSLKRNEDSEALSGDLAPTSHRQAKPGEIITFGAYPQTADGTDRTPIQWRVMENTGSDLFLLSDLILDCQRYYDEFADITWSSSDLRKWLNGDFYNAAFNAAERELVRTTQCIDNGASSPDTDDKVFLLSIEEVKHLTDLVGTDIVRRARGTEFAKMKKSDGCRLYVYDKSVSADYMIENGIKYGCSWWWLRTQPGSPSRAAFVGARASIRGYARVNRTGYGVRPALRMNIRG